MQVPQFRVGGRCILAALLCTLPLQTHAVDQSISRPDRHAIHVSHFGMHFHRMGGETAWPQARIGSWRLWDADVNWWNLEPERGKWDFSKLDRYVAMATQRKVDIVLPLAAPPAWASARPTEASPYNTGSAAEPADLRDWQNYVRTVATRYKGRIKYFELWNEVNEKHFYSGTQEMLVSLAREARAVLKEVDPANQLIGPSVVGSSGQVSYLDQFFAKGGGQVIDIVAYHFYVHAYRPEAMVPLAANVKAVMARHGVDKPLWNTEYGWAIRNEDGTPSEIHDSAWPELTQEQAAGYLIRGFALGWNLGLDRNFWYAWDNYSMGFLEPSTRATKPGGRAWANMVTHFNGANFSGCTATGSVWTCELTTAMGKPARLMWSEDNAKRTVTLPADWQTGTQVSSLETSVKLAAHGKPTLTIGAIPRLIVKP